MAGSESPARGVTASGSKRLDAGLPGTGCSSPSRPTGGSGALGGLRGSCWGSGEQQVCAGCGVGSVAPRDGWAGSRPPLVSSLKQAENHVSPRRELRLCLFPLGFCSPGLGSPGRGSPQPSWGQRGDPRPLSILHPALFSPQRPPSPQLCLSGSKLCSDPKRNRRNPPEEPTPRPPQRQEPAAAGPEPPPRTPELPPPRCCPLPDHFANQDTDSGFNLAMGRVG